MVNIVLNECYVGNVSLEGPQPWLVARHWLLVSLASPATFSRSPTRDFGGRGKSDSKDCNKKTSVTVTGFGRAPNLTFLHFLHFFDKRTESRAQNFYGILDQTWFLLRN